MTVRFRTGLAGTWIQTVLFEFFRAQGKPGYPCLRREAIRRGMASAGQVVLLIDGAQGLEYLGNNNSEPQEVEPMAAIYQPGLCFFEFQSSRHAAKIDHSAICILPVPKGTLARLSQGTVAPLYQGTVELTSGAWIVLTMEREPN